MNSETLIERARGLSAQDRVARVQEIRLIALAALSGHAEDFEAWKYYAELKNLKPKRPGIPFLEARIATCVVGRIRPATAMRTMQKLRNLRARGGQRREFDKFEALIKDHIGEGGVTNHGFGKASFADRDHGALWGRIGSHIETLGKAGYQVFLNSGTLLGVVRDGRLIDHDDDIDLAVVLKSGSAVAAAGEWKALRSDLQGMGVFDAENVTNPAIYKLKPEDGCEIDLFPAWIEEGRVFVYPHTFGELAEDDVLPLATCGVSGRPIPAAAEKMLALNYGEDWRQPDPYFKFPWRSARQRFQTFLEAIQ